MNNKLIACLKPEISGLKAGQFLEILRAEALALVGQFWCKGQEAVNLCRFIATSRTLPISRIKPFSAGWATLHANSFASCPGLSAFVNIQYFWSKNSKAAASMIAAPCIIW